MLIEFTLHNLLSRDPWINLPNLWKNQMREHYLHKRSIWADKPEIMPQNLELEQPQNFDDNVSGIWYHFCDNPAHIGFL